MSIDLESCGIFKEEILNGVVDRLSDPLEEEIQNEAMRVVGLKIEALAGKKVEEIIAVAITKKVEELLSRDIQPLDMWGEKRGKPRSLNDILSDSLTKFWAEIVDANGKPTDRYGNNQTRIEYMTKKIAGEVLSDKTTNEFNQVILNAKAALSDALSKAVVEITDKHLGIKRK